MIRRRRRLAKRIFADFVVPFSTTLTNNPPSSEVSELAFENLNHFSAEELAIVLRSLDPNTILLAVSGASSIMRTRIESLIAPNEVSRLRKKLRSFRRVASSSERWPLNKKLCRWRTNFCNKDTLLLCQCCLCGSLVHSTGLHLFLASLNNDRF